MAFSTGLMTDISESLFYLSSENRNNRKKEKLRQELVREHIENQKQTPIATAVDCHQVDYTAIIDLVARIDTSATPCFRHQEYHQDINRAHP